MAMPSFVIQQTTARSSPLPLPEELGAYEQAHPGAAKWIFDQAEKNADHVRAMETRGAKLQQRDMLLHRLLPFALVCAFLLASVAISFASPAAGGVGLVGTMATVLIAYLKGRAPGVQSGADQSKSQTPQV